VRQLSGVLLGTLFSLYWVRLPPDFKSFVKNNIFSVIAKEEKYECLSYTSFFIIFPK
jgi:hypothetical protein